MKTTRRHLSLSFIFTLSLLSGCSMGGLGGGGSPSPDPGAPHKLVIVNDSGYALSFVRWEDGDGALVYFGDDQVYDAVIQKTVSGIAAGSRSSRDVKPGSAQLRFFDAKQGSEFVTALPVVVIPGSVETVFAIKSDTSLIQF